MDIIQILLTILIKLERIVKIEETHHSVSHKHR